MFGINSINDIQDWEDGDVLLASRAQPWLFTVIVERYQEPFLRKARSIVHNPLDAEEIVQDAFTKIYVYADKYEPQSGAKFSSWAYRILMNTAFTRYQKLVKEGQRFSHIDPEFEQFIGEKKEHIGFEEKRDGIERILDRMPEHLSYVLRLHYLERWSQEDIANETGENVGTIKARIHRAKETFRKESRDGEAEVLL
jgi:RNA polymerase sigma-70 factor (ECF subfamily)